MAHDPHAPHQASRKRPWWKKKRYLIPLALLALIVFSALGGGGGDDVETTSAPEPEESTETTAGSSSRNVENPPQDDVTVTTCEPGQFGVADVALEVVNHSSDRSNYVIQVNLFDEAGTRVGEAAAFVNNLDSGQRATTDALGTGEGVARCELANVERYAS